MTEIHVDNYSAFIIESLLDVSDVEFLQDDVRSLAGNLSEITARCLWCINWMMTGDNYMLYILEPPLDLSDVDLLQDDVRSMADNLG